MNKPRRLWPVVVVATLLLVLYVASFGPVMRFAQSHPDAPQMQQVLEVAYKPLLILTFSGPDWCAVPLRHYLHHCGVRLFF